MSSAEFETTPDADRGESSDLSGPAAWVPPGYSLLTTDALTALRGRWSRVRMEFVEEPGRALLDGEDLIHDVAEALTVFTALRRAELAGVDVGSTRFPEELWATLQRCRSVMEIVQQA